MSDEKKSPSKAAKAAERAATLERMSEEDKALFRKRKTNVSMKREWKVFFETMSGDELKEMVLAIFEYDETGQVPDIKNIAIFKGFIQGFLQTVLDDWYFACYQNSEYGKQGARIKKINAAILKALKEEQKADVFAGYAMSDIVRNPEKTFNLMAANGVPENNIKYIAKRYDELKTKFETEIE